MSLTSFLTTSGATFAGNTSSNISTIASVASCFCVSMYGRYIIERESPYTAKEKPDAGCFDGVLFSAAAAAPAISANRAIHANNEEQSFMVWLVCFIFYFLSLIWSLQYIRCATRARLCEKQACFISYKQTTLVTPIVDYSRVDTQ